LLIVAYFIIQIVDSNHIDWRIANLLRLLLLPFFFIGVVFGSGLHDSSDVAFFVSIFTFGFLVVFITLTIRDRRKARRQTGISN
jgi:uncharacterized membrane protein YfcA